MKKPSIKIVQKPKIIPQVVRIIEVASSREPAVKAIRKYEEKFLEKIAKMGKVRRTRKNVNVTKSVRFTKPRSAHTEFGSRSASDEKLVIVVGAAELSESNKHANVTPPLLNKSCESVVDNPNFYLNIGSDLDADDIATVTDEPILSRGFCDRLTITFDPSMEERATLQKLLQGGSDAAGSRVKIVKRFAGYPASYSERYEARLKEEAEFLLLIECKPRRRGAGYIRIEFTGRSLRREYSDIVNSILEAAFGEGYRAAISNANITRFDATVDILSALKKLLFVTNRARDTTTWIRRGGANTLSWEIETLCYGSIHSDYRVMVYDKGVERWVTKFDDSMNGVKRVEVKFRERKNGRSLTVLDFKRLKNPFAPLAIGSFAISSNKDNCDLFFFLTAVEKYGADGMLQLIKDRQRRSRYRKQLKADPFLWWKPEEVWGQVLAQLQETGLFPADAF